MSYVDESLARGLQKRLRRLGEAKAIAFNAIIESGFPQKTTQTYMREVFPSLIKRTLGPFCWAHWPGKRHIRLPYMLPSLELSDLWIVFEAQIDSKKRVCKLTEYGAVHNHAIERFFMRETFAHEATTLDENTIIYISCVFFVVLYEANLLRSQAESFVLNESKINNDVGVFHLGPWDERDGMLYIVKTLISERQLSPNKLADHNSLRESHDANVSEAINLFRIAEKRLKGK